MKLVRVVFSREIPGQSIHAYHIIYAVSLHHHQLCHVINIILGTVVYQQRSVARARFCTLLLATTAVPFVRCFFPSIVSGRCTQQHCVQLVGRERERGRPTTTQQPQRVCSATVKSFLQKHTCCARRECCPRSVIKPKDPAKISSIIWRIFCITDTTSRTRAERDI